LVYSSKTPLKKLLKFIDVLFLIEFSGVA